MHYSVLRDNELMSLLTLWTRSIASHTYSLLVVHARSAIFHTSVLQLIHITLKKVNELVTLRSQQNGTHFADEISNCVFFKMKSFDLKFSFKKMHLKMLSAKWHPFCDVDPYTIVSYPECCSIYTKLDKSTATSTSQVTPVPNSILCLEVKGQGQRYSSQHSVQFAHILCVSHQDIVSTPVPFVPWQSGLPFPRYNLALKIQGQRYPSQRSPVDSFP